jgi:purine-binding chemotaxis protein CheW
MVNQATNNFAAKQAEAKVDENNQCSLCSVIVGDQTYGVDITQVCEILGPSTPRAVPRAPQFIGGLVHYRGEVLTAVSLRALFEMPPFDGQSCVLVVEGHGEPYGLLVDAVNEVVQVKRDSFEATPSTLDAKRRALLHGAFKLPKGLLIQLDPARLDPMALTLLLQNAAA